MQLPAFCDGCGTPFPSGIEIEDSINIALTGCKAGPCPRCGGMGHVPDGVFNFIGDTIQILAAPSRTMNELLLLSRLLERARLEGLDSDAVAREIQQELPGLAGLAVLLPKTKQDWYAFLTLLLTIVSLLITRPSADTQITVNQVINQTITVSSLESSDAVCSAEATSAASRGVGRNEPCPCGSGLKFKKCCGSVSNPQGK